MHVHILYKSDFRPSEIILTVLVPHFSTAYPSTSVAPELTVSSSLSSSSPAVTWRRVLAVAGCVEAHSRTGDDLPEAASDAGNSDPDSSVGPTDAMDAPVSEVDWCDGVNGGGRDVTDVERRVDPRRPNDGVNDVDACRDELRDAAPLAQPGPPTGPGGGISGDESVSSRLLRLGRV